MSMGHWSQSAPKKDGWQHRGYGAKLLEAAEVEALEKGYERLEITSGIGARGYYRRLGYDLSGHYMAKILEIGSLP